MFRPNAVAVASPCRPREHARRERYIPLPAHLAQHRLRAFEARPIGLVMRDDLVASRMIKAGTLQVISIERFVPNARVAAVLPRTHHRGGNIAWPRPHGNAPD